MTLLNKLYIESRINLVEAYQLMGGIINMEIKKRIFIDLEIVPEQENWFHDAIINEVAKSTKTTFLDRGEFLQTIKSIG